MTNGDLMNRGMGWMMDGAGWWMMGAMGLTCLLVIAFLFVGIVFFVRRSLQ